MSGKGAGSCCASVTACEPWECDVVMLAASTGHSNLTETYGAECPVEEVCVVGADGASVADVLTEEVGLSCESSVCVGSVETPTVVLIMCVVWSVCAVDVVLGPSHHALPVGTIGVDYTMSGDAELWTCESCVVIVALSVAGPGAKELV